MIPKIIHYCWFGNNKKSKLVKKCIKSWKKYAPDYKFIEWNESNFDINSSIYIKEAYECKKWAFVSDFVRFKVLYEYGGIYLDTDVELLRPIDDLLNENFTGFEDSKSVASGLLIGVEPKSLICKLMLDSYNSDNFLIDNKPNLFTVCQRMTILLKENGLIINGKTQTIDLIKVYDSSYFNPKGVDGKGKILPNSYSIHHYAASWYSKKEKLQKRIGPKLTKFFVKIKHVFIKNGK